MRIVQRKNSPGFTLFELVIAMLLAGFVITSIFQIFNLGTRTTRAMVDVQDEEITRNAFFSFLSSHFEELPGNAVIDLRNTSTTEPYTSEMVFEDTPVAFTWGGVPMEAEAMRLITIPTVTDGLDIVLEFYEESIIDSEEDLAEEAIEPFASITLLEDVRLFEWTVLDGRNYATVERDAWPYEWTQQNRRPTFVELEVIFEYGGPRIKRMFWLPSKTSPRTTMNALQNTARQARQAAENAQGGGTGGGDDSPDTEPEPDPDPDPGPGPIR